MNTTDINVAKTRTLNPTLFSVRFDTVPNMTDAQVSELELCTNGTLIPEIAGGTWYITVLMTDPEIFDAFRVWELQTANEKARLAEANATSSRQLNVLTTDATITMYSTDGTKVVQSYLVSGIQIIDVVPPALSWDATATLIVYTVKFTCTSCVEGGTRTVNQLGVSKIHA